MTQPPQPPEIDADLAASNDLHALRREAAGRRRELREAQSLNTTLQGRVEAMERREIVRLASDKLQNPADFMLVANMDAMRAEDGSLDPERTDAEIERVISDGRPHWRKAPEAPPEPPPPLPDLHNGARPGPPEEPPPPSFGQALLDARYE